MKPLALLRRSPVVALLVILVLFSAGGMPLYCPVAHAQADVAPAAPVLTYGSYLGGMSSDEAGSVAVAATGEIYVLGETYSEDLLGQEVPLAGYSDLFVAKFNAAGTQLLYLTVIPSPANDDAGVLRLDGQGNAYLTAEVYDDTFPTTEHARWPTRPQNGNGVLVKLNGHGQVVYSTYLPLDLFDTGQNLAVDAAGNAYVVGTYEDVVEGEQFLGNQIGLLKLSPDGSRLLLDKQIGRTNHDSGRAITLDSHGAIYLAGITQSPIGPPGSDFPVTGNAHQAQCGDIHSGQSDRCEQDAVVVVLDAVGRITYASYHGGNYDDDPHAIATDGKGMVLIVGDTQSTQFPLLHALQSNCPVSPLTGMCTLLHGFVSAIHIRPGASALAYSTYLGSSEQTSWTTPRAAVLDADGSGYVAGYSNGLHLPVKDALQPELAEGACSTGAAALRRCYDGFVIKLTPGGELAFGSYLGGHNDEFAYTLALGSEGMLYVAGETRSDDFPTTANGYQPQARLNHDGFLVQIDMAGSNLPPNGDTKLRLPLIVQ